MHPGGGSRSSIGSSSERVGIVPSSEHFMTPGEPMVDAVERIMDWSKVDSMLRATAAYEASKLGEASRSVKSFQYRAYG